ncbi:amidase [Roseovarius sp. MMSF_3281]|uniref:amidase n=1 Tax=Roseovarius sp. MMSF_3281 TaxID=3046694 RepID=UPI00273D1DCB|nr:amidase [Roseovarius sp. MMSF_3281]
MSDILELGAADLRAGLADGQLSAEELMRATLERVEQANGVLNAVVSMKDSDRLMAEARATDVTRGGGALAGLPICVKDMANAKGFPTSMGSPAFADKIADKDDLFVSRMRQAGAIVIGKSNTPEFALGSHTFNTVHGATCNPYDVGVSCGGSSGGAAVALAARMVPIADGSDMMGSLRNPAGWNNVYGMRPSWGLVPAEPAADTFLHQISTDGPMARSPQDLALLLKVMAGPDPRQPHNMLVPDLTLAGIDPAEVKIGWLGDWGGAYAMDAGILDLCQAACHTLADLGCRVEKVPAPYSREALWDSWTTLRSWTMASKLSELLENPKTRDQIKADAVWEIERGLAMKAVDVHKASVVRSGWFQAAATLFDRYDALVLPTAQVWPFPMDWSWPTEVAGVKMDTYHRWMEAMVPASLAGLPALAMPAGFGNNGLPMGIQLIGRKGNDRRLLEIAQLYHEATLWPLTTPPQLAFA